jgi:hypothetical protein
MWMYSKASKCDDTVPWSSLQVVQLSTCLTRPSLGLRIGCGCWEAQLVLLSDASFLQAVSCAGGSELCIVRMPDGLFAFRHAGCEFASNAITSCAYELQPASGRSKHKCSVCWRDEDQGWIGWTESIVYRVIGP